MLRHINDQPHDWHGHPEPRDPDRQGLAAWSTLHDSFDGVALDENMGYFAREVFPKAGVTQKGAETIVKGWNKLMADTVKATTL